MESGDNVTFGLSDSENDGNVVSAGEDASSVCQFAQSPLSVSHAPRYFFPAPFENLRFPLPFMNSPSPPPETLESTIADMSADLDRFGAESGEGQLIPSPVAGANQMNPLGVEIADSAPCTSVSMLIHQSMEHKATPLRKRRPKTPFTSTQRLQEELYESAGKKPSNLLEENQLLYQTLDYERKRLILRKGLCSFMHGALILQRKRLEIAESKGKAKSEECAARLIFHSLLLQAYRRVQDQLSQLLAENNQLQKSVENLCLQLRVVRHLQSAEKERVVEKVHEIGNLKTELTYVKKILSKTKSELEKVEQECEALEKGNAELAEEKYKMQREQRLLEEKKEMLQGSLEMEKKRTEKQGLALKEFKKQVTDLRQQISDLMKQCDEFNERARGFEAKNWQLQMLLESRGKEVLEIGQRRDALKAEANELEKVTSSLRSKNEDLALEIKNQEEETLELKKCLDGAEVHLRQQSGRIGFLEDEIGRMTRANLSMRNELSVYHVTNIQRRRSWVNFAMAMVDPLGTIFSFFMGRPNDFVMWA